MPALAPESDADDDDVEEVGAEAAVEAVVDPTKQPRRVLRELARQVKAAKKRALSAERKKADATYRVRNGVLPAAAARRRVKAQKRELGLESRVKAAQARGNNNTTIAHWDLETWVRRDAEEGQANPQTAFMVGLA